MEVVSIGTIPTKYILGFSRLLMNILVVENDLQGYKLDLAIIDEEIPVTQFVVIDLGSDLNHCNQSDVIFPKLIFLEEHISSAVLCDIGGYDILLPLSWNIFVGDEDSAEIELIPITELNARTFSTIVTHPVNGFRHHFMDIRIKKVLLDYEWVLPKIKNGQALAVPFTEDNKCIFLTNSASKIPAISTPDDFM